MEPSKSISIQNQSGEILFSGTDVAVAVFFNYLKAGRSSENFLDDYPSVTLVQVLDVLEMAGNTIEQAFKVV
ncbi:MAG: DUF433 domain-containing protein [Mucilaginibacter sp.]|uniref:DUF433 domain-containing protein n=1 Tax=Mucilaginibacter sp. TaxID=1882438 RepID=UPI0034E5485B